MTYAIAFWITLLLWLVLGFIPANQGGRWRPYGANILLFLALLLLGLQAFGAPVHD